MWYSGITEAVYQELTSLGLNLWSFFDSTPYTDKNGNVFYMFTGDVGAWEEFLFENDQDPDLYGIGQFLMIKSTQGTGPV